MSSKLLSGFLMLVLISNLLHGCKREEVAPKGREEVVPKGIEMQLVPSKDKYGLNEDILIKVKLTNRGDKQCRIIPDPEATVQILNLSRNDTPLDSGFTVRTHVDQFEQFLRKGSIELEPHTSRSLSWESVPGPSIGKGVVLMAAPPHSSGTMVVQLWQLNQTGTYTLRARQVVPASENMPKNMCPAGDNPVTITFTVTAE